VSLPTQWLNILQQVEMSSMYNNTTNKKQKNKQKQKKKTHGHIIAYLPPLQRL
jgi:hypothetical protein